MTNPKVSVLIPCYNAERFIAATLESVCGQSWPNLEIIVVDDGSTDRSAALVEDFPDDRVRLIRQANAGVTMARQKALDTCTGDFVQYLDADDLLSAQKIELQLQRLADAPDCVASAEWGRFSTDPAEAKFEPNGTWRDMDALDWLAEDRVVGLGMMFPALWLIPRKIALAAGAWDTRLSRALGEDGEYFTRIVLAARRVLFTPGARCFYRSAIAGSQSRGKSDTAWAGLFQVIEITQSHVLAREDSERMRRAFALTWQQLAYEGYPYVPVVAERALDRARALHPVVLPHDRGRLFKMLSPFIGWRLTRRLQRLTGRP